MNSFIWFDDPEGKNINNTGGKGASLCKMHQFGLPVPNGFVVAAPFFRRFMQESGLSERIRNKIRQISQDDLEQLEAISAEIREMIVNEPFPENHVNQLTSMYHELGEDTPVAVRSSSTAEDLDDASFAGQQETFLYVIGDEDLIQKVKECWASLYNGRAIFYRREKGFSEDQVSIAVVVQKMVNSEKAGVMFTNNPITKNAGEILIEGAWGLGEGVVSGIVTPDNYVVSRNDGKATSVYVSEKETMVVRAPSLFGTVEQDVPPDIKEARVLDESELSQMTRMAERVEQFFGKPEDIEWAFEGGEFYLLQSRPITTL